MGHDDQGFVLEQEALRSNRLLFPLCSGKERGAAISHSEMRMTTEKGEFIILADDT